MPYVLLPCLTPSMPGMSQPPTPAPGWYPDPSNPSAQRYWDGAAWGPTAPLAAYPPPRAEPARFTIHYGFAVLAALSLIGTLFFGIPMLSTASDHGTGGVGAVVGILWMLWGGMWTLIWTAFAVNHTLKARR